MNIHIPDWALWVAGAVVVVIVAVGVVLRSLKPGDVP
jgi:hypothetical protein